MYGKDTEKNWKFLEGQITRKGKQVKTGIRLQKSTWV